MTKKIKKKKKTVITLKLMIHDPYETELWELDLSVINIFVRTLFPDYYTARNSIINAGFSFEIRNLWEAEWIFNCEAAK